MIVHSVYVLSCLFNSKYNKIFQWGRLKEVNFPYFALHQHFNVNVNLGGKEGFEDEAEDKLVMNNLMHDIKEGFIQRRLPDGGFKVSIIS